MNEKGAEKGSKSDDGPNRRCCYCKIWKPRTREHFNYSRFHSLGFVARCRECNTEYARLRRNRPGVRDHQNALGRKNYVVKDGRGRMRRYRQRKEVKLRLKMSVADRSEIKRRRVLARVKVAKLVKAGLIHKPSKCKKCGEDRYPIYAYIKDSSNPTHDIKWLCPECFRKYYETHPTVDALVEKLTIPREEWIKIHIEHLRGLDREGGSRYFREVDRDAHECVLGHWLPKRPPRREESSRGSTGVEV